MTRLIRKFAEGISWTLRVYGSKPPARDLETPEADWLAILETWEAIGSDIQAATFRFSEEFDPKAVQPELPGWKEERELA